MFISAATEPMDRLVEKGIVQSDAVQLMFRNALVLIEPVGKQNVKQLRDLLKPEMRVLVIGQPDTVPAGEYAKEALQNEGLWDDVESKAVYAKDVTQVLACRVGECGRRFCVQNRSEEFHQGNACA